MEVSTISFSRMSKQPQSVSFNVEHTKRHTHMKQQLEL
jgi:hypothetical protein